MKRYRFFYHYNKSMNKMSVHFRGKCHIVENIICLVPSGSKRNKRQPKMVMQGYAERVIVDSDKSATII